MEMRLPELQDDDKKTKKLRSEGLLEGWKNINKVCYYQSLFYVSKVICSKFISRYHDDLLARHFGMEKIRELIARKNY